MNINELRVATGKKWFHFLIPKKEGASLYNYYPETLIRRSMIISAISDENYRYYCLVDNYRDYLQQIHYRIPEEKRTFFELVLGELPQKPHFDIDIDQEDIFPQVDQILETFLKHLLEKFAELYRMQIIPERDLYIFTSHGAKKRSFHVIIDNYCHLNHREAKLFYQRVKEGLDPAVAKWIDAAVYSKKQQFRLLGCQKLNSGRIKTHLNQYQLAGKTIHHPAIEKSQTEHHRFLLELKSSLVGYTIECQLVPSLETDQKNVGDKSSLQRLELQANEIEYIEKLIDTNYYSIREIKGGLIILERLKPAYCANCKRVHHNENPYYLIQEYEFFKMIFWCCRRNTLIYIGNLPLQREAIPEEIAATDEEIDFFKEPISLISPKELKSNLS